MIDPLRRPIQRIGGITRDSVVGFECECCCSEINWNDDGEIGLELCAEQLKLL